METNVNWPWSFSKVKSLGNESWVSRNIFKGKLKSVPFHLLFIHPPSFDLEGQHESAYLHENAPGRSWQCAPSHLGFPSIWDKTPGLGPDLKAFSHPLLAWSSALGTRSSANYTCSSTHQSAYLQALPGMKGPSERSLLNRDVIWNNFPRTHFAQVFT